jgi:hypothetical protein
MTALGIKTLLLLLLPLSALGASAPNNIVTVSPLGKANSSSVIANNGAQYGPDTTNGAGVVTTTSGLQEAINAALVGTSTTTPPGGGAIIQLQAGTYQCTSQIVISNRFANPITIHGISDAPSTILNYKGATGKDFITSAPADGGCPVTTGNLEINLRNLVLSYEPLSKNYICNFTDVQRVFCENVYFTTWGFITNGGLGGNVFPSFASEHAGYVVGIKLGTLDYSDTLTGLAQFKNCRFADLACAGISTIDHVWLDTPHFLLIGGNNRLTPSVNQWAVGGAFTVPDSMFALHPAWVSYALGGDLRIDNPNIYYTYALLLHAKQGTIGHPIIRNTAASGLEGSAWIALQYDDMDYTSSGSRIEIESLTEPQLLGTISFVKKPGTISYRFPSNVRIYKSSTYVLGSATNLTLLRGAVQGEQPGIDLGVSAGGINRFYGTNLADLILGGTTVNMASIAVSGGSLAGINGTYYLSDRMFVDAGGGGGSPGVANTFSWTNAGYAYVWNESASSLNGGGGGMYSLGDSNMVTTLYDGATSFALYPGVGLKGNGQTIADGTNGTPPTIAFTLTTNATFFSGDVASKTLTPTTRITTPAFVTSGSSPTVVTNNGLNQGATLSLNGTANDLAFQLTINTGATTTASATNVTVTFATARSRTPNTILFSANSLNGSSRMNALFTTNITTTGFNLCSTATALAINTVYIYNFLIVE